MKITDGSNISVKEKLILAGIEEIEQNGVQYFSLRRVAGKCKVSCAAPYKHFDGKLGLVIAIIEYINEQWYKRQEVVVAKLQGDYRRQLTEISLEYIRFLVENPHFRSIIMLNFGKMDVSQAHMKSELSCCTQNLIRKYCEQVNLSRDKEIMKTFVVRSLIYGAAIMIDNGELENNGKNFEFISKAIEREFDLD